MVPRSFMYGSSPPRDSHFDEKGGRRPVRKSASPRIEITSALRPTSPARTTTEPVRIPTQPVTARAPAPERTKSAQPQSLPTRNSRASGVMTRKASAHDPNALPPAIAALLAVTDIPRPKKNQFRRRPDGQRRISIDELVNDWKKDESLNGSLSSSPALSVLLEDTDDNEDQCATAKNSVTNESYLHTRSASAESVPSLEDDDRSILSSGSLPTPESLRSRRSMSNLKKEKARSLPKSEECDFDHPLVPPLMRDEDPDDGLILSPPSGGRTSTSKPKLSFKSNLTTSIQALKKAAISSISSFTLNSASTPAQRSTSSLLSDDMLWSHPYLFPRFSPEVRPAIEGTPSKAQRRYLNPMPLTFEEQEAPFQVALHAPFLAERVEGAATIPMQTYARGRRKVNAKRSGPDPQSEAGRALSGGPSGVRQREVRENSDFLRVVVLEMNMRREGKLETGRAKIWLPPRQVSPSSEREGRVPRRWVGVSAY